MGRRWATVGDRNGQCAIQSHVSPVHTEKTLCVAGFDRANDRRRNGQDHPKPARKWQELAPSAFPTQYKRRPTPWLVITSRILQ